MTREFKVGDEPVPGYKVTQFIGRGGFGEVWRAKGPGGTEVALKSIALDRKQGMKEFKSLRLVKRIHHPNLVPILAFWLIDANGTPLDDDSIDLLGSNVLDIRGGSANAATATMNFNAAKADQLIIAMGLGEKNLLDLLKEYQAKNQQGIPLDELLDFMEGSARAIDFLNTARHDLGGDQPVAIQHCDIKPQNIMLVGDAVQVCDFGLARSLTDVRSTSVAGSIAYGAPELFWDNKPTHATDQYSLAITYYELRTGHLPFGPDMAAIEVMQAHRDGKLDLRHVSDAERAVLKRATNPAPAGRFERTLDMVRALRRAAQGGPQTIAAEGEERPPATGIRSSIVQTGREVVPGYTLLEHLFHPDVRTDVWSATGPDGKPHSVWLYDLTASPGAIDRDALQIVQSLSDHPRLARVSGWWMLDKTGRDVTNEPLTSSNPDLQPSTLVIASELTRTNLSHRVEECRQFRGRGIPVEELLPNMQHIAEAVDALNDATHSVRGSKLVSLIHTDLRPANLLLFGNVVKVGNFAWCRVLDGEQADVAGLPIRAARPTTAPELAAGRVHRRTDQYSLAASYVQMRTGNMLLESGLPTGMASGAVAASQLDLSALSDGEVEVIQRAMHADPDQRYPSCRKMVAELALSFKKVSALVESGYSQAGGAKFGNTMLPGDLLAPVRSDSLTVPLRESAVDTKPDVYAPDVAPPKPTGGWVKVVKIAVPAAAVLAFAAVALYSGGRLRRDVEGRLAASQYKEAMDDIEQAGAWGSWRSDKRGLRDQVIASAINEAKSNVEKGADGLQKALDVYAQMGYVLSKQELSDLGDGIFGAAIKYANDKIDASDYEEAHTIAESLAEKDSKNADVRDLQNSLWSSWSKRIMERVRSNNFAGAAAIFKQLESVKNDRVSEEKAKIIGAGTTAIAAATAKGQTVEALDIAAQLKEVKAFGDDTGLSKAIANLVPTGVSAVAAAVDKGDVEQANELHRRLVRLAPYDTQVRELGNQILARQLEKARQRLDEKNWEAALTEYQRVVAGWSSEDESAKESFDELKGAIVQAAKREFDEDLQSDTSKDLERAKDVLDRLSAAFPKNLTVEAMDDSYKARMSSGGAATRTPEQIVQRLLGLTDENIRDRVLDEAVKNLKDADAKIDAELPDRADLRRRSLLTHAFLAWQEQKWDELQSWLNKVDVAELDPAKEAAQRTRFHLLTLLDQARFAGGSLPDDANLAELADAVGELRKAEPDWRESGDRILVARVRDLSRDLARRAVEMAAGEDADQEALASRILQQLDKEDSEAAGGIAETLVAVNKTIGLLADEKIIWAQIKQSLDAWKPQVDQVPPEKLARLVDKLLQWGRGSKEAGALANAIDEFGRMPRKSEELKRQYAGILIEQLAIDASQAKIDWKEIAKQCGRAADAVTNAGGHPRASFVAACAAEAALESALAAGAAPADNLQSEVDAALASADEQDRSYLEYVALRLADAVNRLGEVKNWSGLVDSLAERFKDPTPLLVSAARGDAIAKILVDGADTLSAADGADRLSLDVPPLSKDDVARGLRWLELARSLSKVTAGDRYRRAAAVLALDREPPDHEQAAAVLGELIAGDQAEPWMLAAGAKLAAKSNPAEAVRRYAGVIDLKGFEPRPDNKRLTALYDRVVAPALEIAQKLPSADADLKKLVARLYAEKGKLIRVDLNTEEKFFPTPAAAVFEAYDKAIQNDNTNFEYYIERGLARVELPDLDLDVLERDDIQPAIERSQDSPFRAHGLKGFSLLSRARKTPPAELETKIKLYEQATAEYAEAIRDSGQLGDMFPRILVARSTAYVELASLVADSQTKVREYLTEAEKAADAAAKIVPRPHPEFAYLTLGNAREDFGLYLGELQGYRDALKSFEQAAQQAQDSGLSPATAELSQARCRYRWALSSNVGADERKQILDTASQDLDKVFGLTSLTTEAKAEANYWKSEIFRAQAKWEEAAKAIQLALADTDESSAAWPLYQVKAAEYAVNVADRTNFARKLADSKVVIPPAYRWLAVRYLAAVEKAPAERLKVYYRYLPGLPSDFSKTDASHVELLVSLSMEISADTSKDANGLWNKSQDISQKSAERALELADTPTAKAKAHTALGALEAHRFFVDPRKADVGTKAFDHLHQSISLDSNFSDGAEGCQWRLLLGRVTAQLAQIASLPAAEARQKCDQAVADLASAHAIPKSLEAQVRDLRRQLLQIKSQRSG